VVHGFPHVLCPQLRILFYPTSHPHLPPIRGVEAFERQLWADTQQALPATCTADGAEVKQAETIKMRELIEFRDTTR
jgi:hypothetical protein